MQQLAEDYSGRNNDAKGLPGLVFYKILYDSLSRGLCAGRSLNRWQSQVCFPCRAEESVIVLLYGPWQDCTDQKGKRLRIRIRASVLISPLQHTRDTCMSSFDHSQTRDRSVRGSCNRVAVKVIDCNFSSLLSQKAMSSCQ